jgi:hypothetical protein
VTGVTVVDNDPKNHDATLIIDLCAPNALPPTRFECIILTQTLQQVPDVQAALGNLWTALAPGGVLLLTVPALSCAVDLDLWRFTPRALELLLRRLLPDAAEIEVEGHGHAVTGAAFFLGLAAQDVGSARLVVDDVRYPVVSCARVRR